MYKTKKAGISCNEFRTVNYKTNDGLTTLAYDSIEIIDLFTYLCVHFKIS